MPTPRLNLPDAPLGDDDAGLGDDFLRALNDQLDEVLGPVDHGPFTERPVSTPEQPGIANRRYLATDQGIEYLDLGTGWLPVAERPAFVTALPGSPRDTQEVYLAADASAGVVWHLRYRAAAPGAFKWEFVGGSDLFARTDAPVPTTTDAVAGPTITVPVAGEYAVEYEAFVQRDGNPTGSLYAVVGLVVAGTAKDECGHNVPNGGIYSGQRPQHTIAAGQAFALRYRTDGGISATFSRRILRVRPVRVG